MLLGRMRSMGAQRKHHLQQQFVRIDVTCIARKAVLAAYLAELARPVSQDCGRSGVGQVGKLRAAGTIKASTHKPAAAQLVIARCIEAECALFGRKLLALAPDKFTSTYEGMING